MSVSAAAKVLLIEDHPQLRRLFLDWLVTGGYEAVAAATAEEGLDIARQRSIDLVLTDLSLPGMSGVALLDPLLVLDPHIEVIFLSGAATVDDIIEAMREGRAFDFFIKPVRDFARLRMAIEKALIRRHLRREGASNRPAGPGRPMLTERERDMLAMLARGLDNQAMATRLGLGEKTIRNLLTVLYGKLEVANRTQAALVGRELGAECAE
jgi:DNA-binding NarL/FixJ family response regulator